MNAIANRFWGILLLLLVSINQSQGQSINCEFYQEVVNKFGDDNYLGVIEYLNTNEETLNRDLFKHRLLNIKADCFYELDRFNEAIDLSKKIIADTEIFNQARSNTLWPKENCSMIYGNNWRTTSIYTNEPRTTTIYRSYKRLALIYYKQGNYKQALESINKTDTEFTYVIPMYNCHGCYRTEHKERTILKSRIYEKLGNIESSIAVIIKPALKEYELGDTLATSRLIEIYRHNFSVAKLKAELQFSIENLLVVDHKFETYDDEDYSRELEGSLPGNLYAFTIRYENGRAVFLFFNNNQIIVNEHNDFEHYKGFVTKNRNGKISKKKDKEWRPISNENLIAQSQNSLLLRTLFRKLRIEL